MDAPTKDTDRCEGMSRPWRMASASLALLGLLWAGVLWPEAAILSAGRCAAALVLVFWWPAALLARSRAWPGAGTRQSGLHYASAVVLLNTVAQSLVLAFATLFGHVWSDLSFAAAQTAITLACTTASLAAPRMGPLWDPESRRRLRRGMAGLCAAAAAVAGYVFVTFQPRGFDEDRWWPLEVQTQFDALEPAAGLALEPGPQWRVMDERVYRIDADAASANLVYRGAPGSQQLALLVEAHREGDIEIVVDSQTVAKAYAHPRFDPSEHTRNYPPPNFLLAPKVTLKPGTHRFELRLDDTHAARRGGYLVVTDLTGLAPAEAIRVFKRRNLIANVGDTRSNLDLARSLMRRPYPWECSYSSEEFDGGGYVFSNLPFPYYPFALALLACRDTVMGIGWLHVAMLVGLWAIVRGLWLGIDEAPLSFVGIRWAGEAVCLLSVLSYATLMRFMIESVFIHTVLTFVFLMCVYHLLKGNTALCVAYGVLAALTKGGVVLLGVVFVVALVVRPLPRRRVLRTGLICAGVSALFGVAIYALGSVSGALPAWEANMLGNDYAGRFSLLAQAWQGSSRAWATLARAGWELTDRVLAAGGFVALLCLIRPDRASALLCITALAFHVVVCISDPGIKVQAHPLHPLNYFTPTSLLLVAAGLRSLGRLTPGRWRQVLGVGLVGVSLFGLARCQARSAAYRLSPLMAPQWDAMHVCCVNDYLLRRAETRLRAGRDAGAAHDLQWVLAGCSRHMKDAHARYQRDRAIELLRRCRPAEDGGAASRAGPLPQR